MKILFITSNFPPYIGGGERQALLLARTLRQQVIDVEVLTRPWPGRPREEVMNGVPVHRRGLLLAGKIGSVLAAFSWLFFVLFHGRCFQVFHAHQPYSALWVALSGKALWRGKVVLKLRGSGEVKYIEANRMKRALLMRYVDQVIVVNQDHHAFFLNIGALASKIAFIPNGVEMDEFARRDGNDPRQNEEEKSIVFIGRLIQSKGLDLLMDCWKIVEEEEPSAFLYLIGDGPCRDLLESKAHFLDLRRVSFAGFQENVQPYLEKASIFAFPSRSEGLSNSLLEAMASGLPVVATNVEGTRDVIRDGQNGLLVEPDNPNTLSAAILRMLRGPDLRARLGREARRTVERSYSIEAVARQYGELYTRLVAHDR